MSKEVRLSGGKTRLAVHLAADVAGDFAGGAWWVDLVELNDTRLVPQAISQVLGLREVPGQIPPLERFEGAPQLAAFAGLTPSQHQSGSSVFRRGRLAKTGNAHLRRALYMPALVALGWNPVVQVFAERLRERGKHKMVIIGAVMRKLLHIVYGILKSGMPFDPNYAVNVQDPA